MKLRILAIQSNLDDAHQLNLIEQFRRAGCEVKVCGFRRPYYRSDSRLTDVVLLGELEHGRVLSRLPTLKGAVRVVRALSKDIDVVLTFGLDTHLLALSAVSRRRALFIREVADLPRILSSGTVTAWFFRGLEKFSLARLDALLVTSSSFADRVYRPMLGSQMPMVHVVENKVSPADVGPRLPSPTFSPMHPVTIGYFGLLRCSRTLECLITLADHAPNLIKVAIRGHKFVNYPLEESVASRPNITFGGPYSNPADLRSIYTACDVVWSCYPYDPRNMNCRFAKTNRFYEAGYFRRPQISHAETMDGEAVDREQMGITINLSDIELCVRRILSVTPAQWSSYAENTSAQPESAFSRGIEIENVIGFLKAAGRGRVCV